ncbi:phosphoribosylanthranilate isomerase [Actinokineospora diospyrosa]|uniref:N-(5'-phosphoribosyl)anthranilate isomerase n=1 Tax=Actinokineospora diospyrosa TaxID=103728 RepID=A0ABT1IN67_9PSEU|nr:phosphoribosylanthranilate isomerase [Actinokineospora diospyrosa]MCP2273979.1 phosphoribosylanthranilate isomerase [Actinokineospora diospyrosa]
MFVKVCGLRTAEDVDTAVSAGADAIGFVFAASPRQVGVEQARELAARVPEHVLTVGVFLGVPAEQAGQTTLDAGLGAVQLHGDYPREAFDAVADLPLKVIRAVSATPSRDLGFWGADMLLLDSAVAGSGERWDLSTVDGLGGRWLLAGGLDPDNVAAAITVARPWGVDVSSGVESSRGVKDPALIRSFLAAVRAA